MVENEFIGKVGIPAGVVIGAAFNYALPSIVEGHPATLPEVGNYLNLLVHANPGPLVLTGMSAGVGVLGGGIAAWAVDSFSTSEFMDNRVLKQNGIDVNQWAKDWRPGAPGPWDQQVPFPYRLDRRGGRIWKRNW